jgi:hypothetical protein
MSMSSDGYVLRISRLTVDKLGVKLYDKASAVVAELIANSYDADATEVEVALPLGTELAERKTRKDLGYEIVVRDNGHGMTPDEARAFFLNVGRDRRQHAEQGPRSRERNRHVMGRKGIGKLAPFGICRRIEVLSSGGDHTPDGYLTTNFHIDYDKILTDDDGPVPLEAGALDNTYQPKRGTTIRLTNFQPKRVPPLDTFRRQVARRFAFADEEFEIRVSDTRGGESFVVPKFDVPVVEATKIDVASRPVMTEDGEELPVSGWLALAQESYRDEEMAGVRIYTRKKITATTRDFEQPAGFTGEYTIRSYLVGEVHAEWLDSDEGDDLIRTDRQSIIWDSELGIALRTWGADIIREIGEKSRAPRRARKVDQFMELSKIREVAAERFEDEAVVEAAVELGKAIGGFAAEDELADEVYVRDLTEVILSVAPHRALMDAFAEFAREAIGKDVSVESLVGLFGKARAAELASYAQIAAERVQVIDQLEEAHLSDEPELALQGIITQAPWLIRPDWTLLSHNQALLTFKKSFEKFYKDRTGDEIDLAIDLPSKRPDFVLVSVAGELHIVEIKAPGHDFDEADFERLNNYVDVFAAFAEKNPGLVGDEFKTWVIDLIADGVKIKGSIPKKAYEALLSDGLIVRASWTDFLMRAKKAHEQFLETHRLASTMTPAK